MAAKVEAAQMPQAFLQCHAFGHWWEAVGDTDVTVNAQRTAAEFTRLFACRRRGCKKTKSERRSTTAHLSARARYNSPDGYSFADLGGACRYRLAWLSARRRARDHKVVADPAPAKPDVLRYPPSWADGIDPDD